VNGEAAQHDIALLETALFVDAVYRHYGADFRGFDRASLERRLAAMAAHAGAESISALQGRVLRDAQLARASFRALSESATPFLTSPSAFMALRCAVLPVLRSASWPVLWIAECADPLIVIELAIMLSEEGLAGKTQLFITHPNEDILIDVARLQLDAADMEERAAAHMRGGALHPLGDYCEAADGAIALRADLRQNMVWSQYDLASDASFKEFELVVCQRPLAEFDPALQRRALDIFGKSLCNFGILQVEAHGGALSADLAHHFISILPEQGIYRHTPDPRLAAA
jgi:chemotaxis protein methyltransferase CheR